MGAAGECKADGTEGNPREVLQERTSITIIGTGPEMQPMAISADLGRQLESVVENLVQNGRYNSKSEVLREGVRLVQEREARLVSVNAAIARGIADADGGMVVAADEVFASLEAKYRARVNEFDEKREKWLQDQIAARAAEILGNPSAGVPIDEAFEQILNPNLRQR
jgi:antitoxin ParD1/3/4